MKRLWTSGAYVLAAVCLGAVPAGAQTLAASCAATQPQLAQRRAELDQTRIKIAQLDAAIATYREGIEFQEKNAIQGVLNAAIAGYGTAVAAVVKTLADTTLAVGGAADKRVAAVEKAYQGATNVVEAGEAYADGKTGEGTAKALTAATKVLAGDAKQAAEVAGKTVEGANAMKKGDGAGAIAGTAGAIAAAVASFDSKGGKVLSAIGNTSAAFSGDASASKKAAEGLEAGSDVADLAGQLAKTIATSESLQRSSGYLKAGATIAKSQDKMFEHLNNSVDSLDMRADIRNSANLTEAQFRAKMNGKMREKGQIETDAVRLEAEVSMLERQEASCLAPQLQRVGGDTQAPDDSGYGGRYGTSGRGRATGGGPSGGGFGLGLLGAVEAATGGSSGRGRTSAGGGETNGGGQSGGGAGAQPPRVAPRTPQAEASQPEKPRTSSGRSGGCRETHQGEGSCGER